MPYGMERSSQSHSWTVSDPALDHEDRSLVAEAPVQELGCPGPRGNPKPDDREVERGMEKLLAVITH